VKLITHDPAGYPFVFLVESIAQMAGIAVGQNKDQGAFLAAVDRAEFASTVGAGDVVEINVRVVKSFGRLFICEGNASVEGRTVASASITLGVGNI
jgi:3-hydroxyacyl-[acyl-carrier-protein] dehydratase